jgi:hypothetical protein
MKEQEPVISKVQSKLTTNPIPNRLELKGNSMPPTPGGGGPDVRGGMPTGGEPTSRPPSWTETRRALEAAGADVGLLGHLDEVIVAERAAAGGRERGPRTPRVDFSTDEITNPALLKEAEALQKMVRDNIVDRDSLVAAYERVAKMDDPDNQAGRLLSRIRDQVDRIEGIAHAQTRERMRRDETGQDEYSEADILIDSAKREKVFNGFFADADSIPDKQFKEAFNPFTIGMYYERFLRFIRESSASGELDSLVPGRSEAEITELRAVLRSDFQRYQKEYNMRQSLHDANYALYYPSLKFEELHNMQQGFRSELGDYANRIPGVRQMMDLLEASLREDMAAHDGYLRQAAVLDTVDAVGAPVEASVTKTVKDRFRKMWESGQIFSRDEMGNSVDVKQTHPAALSEWEVDRIFWAARGMEVVSMRLLSLAAESKLPRGKGSRYTSLWLQDLLQGYSGYMHSFVKYNITERALRPYLYNKDGIGRFLGLLGKWDPKTFKKIWADFESDPQTAFDGDVLRYIQRLNPNRCGDIFTWLSWRVETDELGVPSAVQDFLQEGRRKMWWREAHHGEPFPPPDADIWQTMPAGYANNEYANWIGTGLRFEKLRGALANPAKKAEYEAAKVKAENLLERMATLQPHRMYLVSERIRSRLYFGGIPMTQDQISKALFGLSRMESAFYAKREELLNEGKTFDQLSLDNFYSVITDPTERALAGRLAFAVKEDFNRNQNLYWKEFVTDRESTHGFVLWSGDAPVDEFNMVALGDTGGYARRFRDNKAQTEAFGKEMELLGNLKHVQNADQLVAGLEEVYKKIAEYDAPKAKEAVLEKAIMLLKFFKEESFADYLPVYGPLRRLFGKTSAAQLAFGRTAPSWAPSVIGATLIRLKDLDLITQEGYNQARETLLAQKRDVGAEATSTLSQFMALAMAIYILQSLVKDELKAR